MSATWWLDSTDLNEEQLPIIQLPIGKSYLITGPPGSGKTNLILLRANYLYLSAFQNIDVVVFTRTLQEFIVSGGHQYDFPIDKVKTSKNFYVRFLRRYGITVQLPKDFNEMRDYLIEKMEELVQKRNLAQVYEALLIDEGHSFLPKGIDLFKKLSKSVLLPANLGSQGLRV